MVVPTKRNDILLPFYSPHVSFTKCQGFNMSLTFSHTYMQPGSDTAAEVSRIRCSKDRHFGKHGGHVPLCKQQSPLPKYSLL